MGGWHIRCSRLRERIRRYEDRLDLLSTIVKMSTASPMSSSFPEAILPFLNKRPSSRPTRVDSRLFRARLTKRHTVESKP